MATAIKWYGNAFAAAFNKEIDFNETGKIMLSLHTSSYVPDQDAHDYFDDVTNEVTSANYTAGGAALTSAAITYTGGTNVVKFDADDVTWTSVTFTARYGVLRYDTGTASTSPLIAYLDFDGDKSPSAGNFTVSFNASGIATITPA